MVMARMSPVQSNVVGLAHTISRPGIRDVGSAARKGPVAQRPDFSVLAYSLAWALWAPGVMPRLGEILTSAATPQDFDDRFRLTTALVMLTPMIAAVIMRVLVSRGPAALPRTATVLAVLRVSGDYPCNLCHHRLVS
jgi:hypothetical protein